MLAKRMSHRLIEQRVYNGITRVESRYRSDRQRNTEIAHSREARRESAYDSAHFI